MKKLVCLKIIFLVLCIFETASAQDSLLINLLLQNIKQEQVSSDNFFLKRIFRSYITPVEVFSTNQKDNNIFFNALIAYTLQHVSIHLSSAEQSEIDSILNFSKPLFQKFENQKRSNTYNFWRTDSFYQYPYGGVLKPFVKNLTLPDDMDDTVLSLMALNTEDSTANALHLLMQHYINTDSTKVRTVLKKYKPALAYSVWFGKKFPVVFDVSVLCNLLVFAETYHLQWTKADSASLKVILQTIKNNYHLTKPVYASPYYPQTSVILYHIARLMSLQEIPELEMLKTKLIDDALYRFSVTNNVLEKIILSTALLKWGYAPPLFTLPSENEIENVIEKNDFCFFSGNIPSYFPSFLRWAATSLHTGIFYHYCPAYNDVLLLEYLILRRNF